MGNVMLSCVAPNMTVPVTGIMASDIAVGSIVKLMEDGVATDDLVVNEGIPSGSSLYDASCDGMWLLRKEIIEQRVWDVGKSNVLDTSDIQAWLNSDMLAKYDSAAQSAIKQVKIPYRKNGGMNGSNQSGANGLSCKAFMLSVIELGIAKLENLNGLVDGDVLSYFKTNAQSKLVAYFNGEPATWSTRSPESLSYVAIFQIQTKGNSYGVKYTNESNGIRPEVVVSSNALFNKNTMVLVGVE